MISLRLNQISHRSLDNFQMIFFILTLVVIIVGYGNGLSSHCDAEIKELDIYQMGINLNLTRGKNLKKYELIQHYNIFAIHPSTGFLQTIRSIDREALCHASNNCDCLKRKCVLELTIFASDLIQSNKPPERIYKTICIEDINDNSPSFPELTQTIEINEKSPIGTELELHSAQDRDSSDFAIIKYDMKCSENIFNLSFSIFRDKQYKLNHQVKLIVTQNISFRYDPIQCTLTAWDLNSSSSMRLIVKVNDINDHSPEWPNSKYYIRIKENLPLDSIIHTFQATDADTVYGKVSYSIGRIMVRDIPKTFSGNLFTIDSITGDMKLNGNLDFEERLQREYIVTIIAKDNGTPSLSSPTTAVIDIEDFNDNPPIININRGIIDVEENTPPNYLDYFTVFDNDEDANGKIECEILEWGEYFNLKKSTANIPITYEIYLSQILDYEKQSMIALIIQCQDGGKPNLTSKKRIAVNVIDVNDNRVYFPQKTIRISIPENIPIGSEIIRISTIDLDKKSEVAFSIVHSSNCSFVNIDTNNGYLTTNEMFDRETKDEYAFEVQVVEKDNVNFTDTVKVILRISDINDNKPVFDAHYSFSIPENTSVDGFIGRVRAIDNDLGENGTVSYVQVNQISNQRFYFTVSNYGEIRLFHMLDIDKQNIHQVTIVARDQGRPISMSSSTTVFITVLDSNNHPPEFEKPFFALTLSCQIQTIDKNLFPSTDKDKSPENTKMNYLLDNIKPLEFKSLFKIDKLTGTIAMTVKENDCNFKTNNKEKVEIKVSVFDPTKPLFRGSTILQIILENERYHKNVNEEINRSNQGPMDISTNKKYKGPHPETENTQIPEESVDQNITIIMVLIFVILFLGIFLITIICFVKKRRQADDEQDVNENTIMVREKVNASIQSGNKSDFHEHSVDSYQMPMKKINSQVIRYPTMTDNRKEKHAISDINSSLTPMPSVEPNYQKSILQYEIAKMKDNNTYQSLTINPKFANVDQSFSTVYSFQQNQSLSSRASPIDKNQNIVNNPNLITNQPNNRSYISVSFV